MGVWISDGRAERGRVPVPATEGRLIAIDNGCAEARLGFKYPGQAPHLTRRLDCDEADSYDGSSLVLLDRRRSPAEPHVHLHVRRQRHSGAFV